MWPLLMVFAARLVRICGSDLLQGSLLTEENCGEVSRRTVTRRPAPKERLEDHENAF